jgi:hypothetical protein
MTTQTIRDAAAFPAVVTAAFFVRNAALIITLLILAYIVCTDI